MKTIIIDTNGYLRLLLDDIPAQADEIAKLLQKAQKGEVNIVLPQIVIFEIVFILEKYYQLDKSEAIHKVMALVLTGYIQVEEREVFIHTLNFYKFSQVSFVDVFLLQKAMLEQRELFTFDQELQKSSLRLRE